MSEAQPSLLPVRGGSHRERILALMDCAGLSPILRTLLTADGTVTEVLAAYFGEDVGVRVLSQVYRDYEGRRNRELDAPAGTRMLDRVIVLCGSASGRIYAAAGSRLIPHLLPPGMQEALLAEREPLGKLMLDHRLENFKEIVDCGRGPVSSAPPLEGSCAEALGLTPTEAVAWRTYRVINRGRPVMSITEYFPEKLA